MKKFTWLLGACVGVETAWDSCHFWKASNWACSELGERSWLVWLVWFVVVWLFWLFTAVFFVPFKWKNLQSDLEVAEAPENTFVWTLPQSVYVLKKLMIFLQISPDTMTFNLFRVLPCHLEFNLVIFVDFAFVNWDI